MTDEDKKKIVSEPPPPTDEIDGEWGVGDDDEKTLIREVPEGVSQAQPAPSAAAVSGTAVAPISVPPKAAEASTPPEMKAAARVENEDDEEEDDEEEDAPVENEDEDDEEEEEDDEEEDDEEEDDEAHETAAVGPAAASADWLPEWAPYAVLAGLVSASVVFGLGLVGGGSTSVSAEEDEKPLPAASAVKKAPVKPSAHP